MTTIVALHGFTGSPAAFEPISRAGHTVISPWLSGHGPVPCARVTFESEVDRLLAIVDDVPDRVVLLGYSLGARLALGVLDAYERRRAGGRELMALVLIGVSASLDGEQAREARVLADAAWASRIRREGVEAFAHAWAAQPLFATQASLPEATRAARHAQRVGHDADALAGALDAFSLGRMPDFSDTVRRAARPLVFMAGELDIKFAGIARSLADSNPRARSAVAPAVGHDVLLEAPTFVVGVVDELMGDIS